jgi:hypothetical protein
MMVLDGKRTFVLGLYQLPAGAQSWRRAKAAGFQVVHTEAKREVLDEAGANGLLCWVTTGSLRQRRDQVKISALVNRLRDHRALVWWETEDEPSFTWNKPGVPRVSPGAIRNTYMLLKKLDPGRLVYLNHSPTNLVSTLQQYNPGGDLIATDIYPVIPHGIRTQYALWPDAQQGDLLDTSLNQVGRYVDKMRQVAGLSRGLFFVLQGFAWEMLRKEGDRDPKMVLYPTRGQLRFMAWQAIVHGVTGLLWWGLRFTPPEAPLWPDVAAVAGELSRNQENLSASATHPDLRIEYHDTGHSLDNGIQYAARGKLLVFVNADKNPIDATIHGLPAGPVRRRFGPFDVWLR